MLKAVAVRTLNAELTAAKQRLERLQRFDAPSIGTDEYHDQIGYVMGLEHARDIIKAL